MPTERPRILVQMSYDEAAQEYLRNLTLEQIMEATPQSTQREITLESLALVRAQRSDVKVFNELLVQYPLQGSPRPGQVVPDNMVVLYNGPIDAVGSYDVPFQPVGPFWTLEYVSRSSKRKDYDDNVRKYEHELKVPYYLLFAPEEQELTLYRIVKEKYVTVLPNEHGRYAIAELDLELAILEGWVRFWYRGELLPLPPEWWQERQKMLAVMQEQGFQIEQERRSKEEERRQKEEERRQKEEVQRQANEARQVFEKELSVLRAELEQLRQQKGT
jgi:Uma2 family endonuclease